MVIGTIDISEYGFNEPPTVCIAEPYIWGIRFDEITSTKISYRMWNLWNTETANAFAKFTLFGYRT